MKQNEKTAFEMAKKNESVNAENHNEIQQVINDATILARKVARLRYNYEDDDEDRRYKTIRKASDSIENAIEALGTLYGFEIIGRAMDAIYAIDYDTDLTDEETLSVLVENKPEV